MSLRPTLSLETQARRLAASPNPIAPACDISWDGTATPGAEATIQAESGLMEVHGWDFGGPHPLGIEVASVATGLLATCGTLAAGIGARRDRSSPRVATTVMAGGLLLVAHHIAAATAEGDPLPSPAGPDPGPPFATADGRWFEIEVFDPDAWDAFWQKLGAGEANVGRAWTSFRHRYYRGLCSLPAGLHDATRRHTLVDVAAVAEACAVSLCPIRTYDDLGRDRTWAGRQLRFDPGMSHTRHPGVDSGLPPAGQPAGDPGTATTRELRAAAAPGSRLPLEGLVVLEATNRMQGPLAGLLLQLLGATVTRIEPPGGDIGRMVPPECDGVGSFFACYNRDKRTLELDLTQVAERRRLVELMASADVFLHNWRPGRAEAWQLDRDAAAAANPALVYAEASGWGPATGFDRVIGTDFLVQAYAGFGEGLNPPADAPRTSRVLLVDCLGALVTCESILAGLHLRETEGARNVSVNPSLLEGAMAAQAHVLASIRDRGDGPRCRLIWDPLRWPLPTSDGELVVVAVHDDAGRDHLSRVASIGAGSSDEAVAAAFATRPASYWVEELPAVQVPCARVARDLAGIPTDPRWAAFFHPLSATCRGPASPWTFL